MFVKSQQGEPDHCSFCIFCVWLTPTLAADANTHKKMSIWNQGSSATFTHGQINALHNIHFNNKQISKQEDRTQTLE